MKSNFKYVVAGIISCLTLVFIWQLIWLTDLYNSIKEETERSVISCIEQANIEELQQRMDALDKEPNENNSISVNYSTGNDKAADNDSLKSTRTKQVIKENDTTTYVESKNDSSFDLRAMDELFSTMREILHQTIDSIRPINLMVLDSVLTVNFSVNKIESEIYYIEIINTETSEIITSSIPSDSIITAKTQPYVYIYDSQNNLGYRVHISSLTKTVLMQMGGILGTTALIIIILGFAFWYLVRTVIRQKTLEEMKDDFTNNMTHELKTPIAVAYSATDALLNFKQGDNKEKRDKYLMICKDQLSHLTGLVEQILSMSMERRRSFVLNKENIQLKELMNILVEQHRLKTEKNIVINVNVIPEDINVYADRTHLSNMVSNLIDNAIKYSADDIIINISVYDKNSSVYISVKDNGIGISAEKQKYIFDKFYRVPHGNKHDVKGYGLGLFYVKTMADKHGGSVSLESQQGKGSVFTIKIPVK